ncbi:alpha/beta fold hydrolase [Nocardia sp. NPDC001965]
MLSVTVELDCMQLYAEERGTGPDLVMVTGAGGDAGMFDAVADHLAATHRVITFDRRGNSRSTCSHPGPWTVEQQAGDLAAVCAAMHAEHSILFGTSSGAVIALAATELGYVQPARLLLHEPAFILLLPEGQHLLASLRTQLRDVCEESGADVALEWFLLNAGLGIDAQSANSPELWARIRKNGSTFFSDEFEALSSYVPKINSELPPITLLHSEDSPEFIQILALASAATLNCRTALVKGGHLGYLEHSQEFARAISEAAVP